MLTVKLGGVYSVVVCVSHLSLSLENAMVIGNLSPRHGHSGWESTPPPYTQKTPIQGKCVEFDGMVVRTTRTGPRSVVVRVRVDDKFGTVDLLASPRPCGDGTYARAKSLRNGNRVAVRCTLHADNRGGTFLKIEEVDRIVGKIL